MISKYMAHITIEADTPLKVGSNASDFVQDAPVQKDWNSLPMILGTSIAGVLRKDFDKSKVDDIFGKDNGSKIIISNALLVNEKGKVCEELLLEKSPFLKLFDNLPIREHTAITHKGVAKGGAKFDEEVVYKGTRFKFSIELIEDDKKIFEDILDLLSNPTFRLGGGSTKGFGKFEVVEIKTTDKECSSSLNTTLQDTYENKKIVLKTHTNYTLKIKPDDFFMFGSGFGDEDADATPVYERVIKYDDENKKAYLDEKQQILIPASSIKGTLSHRTAFHYNKMMLEKNENHTKVAEDNDAVRAIFGHKKETKDGKELGQKGKILISDCFKEKEVKTKVFDHVAIDRFTGGAIDSALFNEKTIYDHGEFYNIEILLENSVENSVKNIHKEAFEKALLDITTGMLPLGGMTTKGHGIFNGDLLRDGEQL